MYIMLFYTTSLGPSVGDPTAMYTPPLRYKREEYVRTKKEDLDADTDALTLWRAQAIYTQWM